VIDELELYLRAPTKKQDDDNSDNSEIAAARFQVGREILISLLSSFFLEKAGENKNDDNSEILISLVAIFSFFS
jgi:hypothetical protein